MTQRDQLLHLYAIARDIQRQTREIVAELEPAVKTADADLAVDAVYALKKTAELLDNARKTVSALITHAERIGCFRVINSMSNELRGEWASGHASTTDQPAVPHPDREPEQYAELMRALGASDELIAAKTMRPSFNAINQYAQSLAEEGRPLPPAFKHVRLVPRYSVTARSKHAGGMERILDEHLPD